MNDVKVADSVVARLTAIERQNRMFKVAAATLAIGLILAFVLGAARTTPTTLDASQLIIRGEDGRVRAKIEATDDGGVVQLLMDKSGTERIRLAVNGENEARIWVNDDDGEVRVAAFSFPTESEHSPKKAGLSIIGAGKGKELNEKPGISFATFQDGQASQSIFDANGKDRAFLGLLPDGVAAMSFSGNAESKKCGVEMGTTDAGLAYHQFFGKDGKRTYVANADPDGSTRQFFIGSDDKTRLMFGLQANGTAQASFLDHNAKPRMTLLAKADGDSHHLFYDNSGKERISANVFDNGLANRRLSDKDGEARVVEYSSKDGTAGQILFSENGDIVANNDASSVTPHTVAKPVLGNDTAARQRELEAQIRSLDDNVAAAQVALATAKAVYNNTEAGSFAEVAAELAYIAAQRTLADYQATRQRAQHELDSLRR